jgi:hypothetical protein
MIPSFPPAVDRALTRCFAIAMGGLLLLAGMHLLAAAEGTNQARFPQPGWITDGSLKAFAGIGERWQKGQTNLPVFHIRFFGPWDVVASTFVEQNGRYIGRTLMAACGADVLKTPPVQEERTRPLRAASGTRQ